MVLSMTTVNAWSLAPVSLPSGRGNHICGAPRMLTSELPSDML